MRRFTLLAALAAALALAGCNDRKAAAAPPPAHALTAAAIGNYCGMNVLEHPGPKGQILLASRIDPVWFSSARDTLAFTLLPEEPKDILAIYVSDMARAPSWDRPGAENWVEARRASFVIESRFKGGMGVDEAVPFSDREAAERFAATNGGRVVAFADVPPDYVLGSLTGAIGPSPDEAPAAADRQSHEHRGGPGVD